MLHSVGSRSHLLAEVREAATREQAMQEELTWHAASVCAKVSDADIAKHYHLEIYYAALNRAQGYVCLSV